MKKKLFGLALAFGMLLTGSITAIAEDVNTEETAQETVTEETAPETVTDVFATDLLKNYEKVDIFGAGEPFTSDIQIEKGKYINITTNSLDCWGTADAFTFLVDKETINIEKYPVTEVVSTVCELKDAQSPNAASGPMIRANLKAGSPHVLLRVRPSGNIILSWRLMQDNVCKYISGPKVDLPVKLKLERNGDVYTAYYKNPSTSDENAWKEVGSVLAPMGNTLYNGFCTFAINQSAPVTASLRRLSIRNFAVGQTNAPTPADFAKEKAEDSEDMVDDEEKLRVIREKIEALKAFYLIEKFEDMSLTTGEESVENTKWHTSEPSPVFEKDENNTVWWVRNKVGNLAYVGKPTWADYRVSFDFILDKATAENVFTIYVRTKPDVVAASAYKPCYYSFNINNSKLYMMKSLPFRDGNSYNKTSVVFPDFADGLKHTMVIEAFDNTLTLYVDGKVCFKYTDDSSFPHTRGMIGFDTRNVNIKISNLIVEKMEDELGGIYDNYMCTAFNEPVLDIIKKSIVIGE